MFRMFRFIKDKVRFVRYAITSKKSFYIGLLTLPTIYFLSSIDDILYEFLPNKMKNYIFVKALKDKFNTMTMTITSNKEGKLVCEVFPTNIFDIELLFSIASNYNVKVFTDNSVLDSDKTYIKVNLSKYNKFNVNEHSLLLQVSEGINMRDLIFKLKDEGFYIEGLDYIFNEEKNIHDKYISKFQHNTLSEYIHNEYYNILSNGKLFSDAIHEILVITPESRALNIKRRDNMHYSSYDLIPLFTLSGQTLGITPEIKLKIKKLSDISLSSIDYDDYNENIYYRKIKIPLRNKDDVDFIISKLDKRINLISKENEEKIKYNINTINNIAYLTILFIEDFHYIDNCITICDYITQLSTKLNTRAIFDQEIIGSDKYKYNTQRSLGVNAYYMNEEIKAKFDPLFILNPHLSLIKPKGVKLMKRNNKMMNYLINKLELD